VADLPPVVRLDLLISLNISEKIQNDLNIIFRGLGKMIHGKNEKISEHCPFKGTPR
jgi:hypothetical protein